jgi:hypothetical protein
MKSKLMIGRKIKMGKVPVVGAKMDFEGGFLSDAPKSRKRKGKWDINHPRPDWAVDFDKYPL